MNKSTTLCIVFGVALITCVVCSPAFAVTIDTLKEPIKDFKSEIFGGWLGAVKIAAFAGGLVMSVARFTFAPAVTGIVATAGIHFFDKYLGDGATGALI